MPPPLIKNFIRSHFSSLLLFKAVTRGARDVSCLPSEEILPDSGVPGSGVPDSEVPDSGVPGVPDNKVLDVCDESDPDKYKSGLVTWPGSVNLPCSSIWMERSDFLLPFPSFGKFLVTDSIPDSSTGLGGSVLPSPLCVRAIGSVYLLVSSTRMERSVSPLPSPTCDGLPFSSTFVTLSSSSSHAGLSPRVVYFSSTFLSSRSTFPALWQIPALSSLWLSQSSASNPGGIEF